MQTSGGRTGNADLGKALCIITGASKGFGRSLAQLASPLLRPGSVMVLVARSGDKLREVQSEISGTIPAKDGLEIRCVEADLGRKEGLQEVVRVVSEIEPQAIDHVLLINNACEYVWFGSVCGVLFFITVLPATRRRSAALAWQ
ncbi:UNVERIFIED_CONTAM: hypothetical protein FKN15_046663 [Acipenser sinensis]